MDGCIVLGFADGAENTCVGWILVNGINQVKISMFLLLSVENFYLGVNCNT